MAVPLAGAAALAAARIIAKKLAKDAAKKAVKKEAKANARGLKAANKPTKASKTFIGDNKKVSVEYRRGVLKSEKPANPRVTRAGRQGLATTKKVSGSGSTSNVKIKPAARQKPNKYNPVKDEVRYIDSVARGASKMPVSQISKGKLKDARAFKASKKSK